MAEALTSITLGLEDLGLTPAERCIAKVLASPREGESEDLEVNEAFESLARHDPDGRLARLHRASAALYLRANRRGLELSTSTVWLHDLRAGVAHHLRMQVTVEEIGACLGAAGIEWVPLKGYDMVTRYYDVPEERLTADIDLLIRPEHLSRARHLLEQDEWQGLYRGARCEEYLSDEGYAWLATKAECSFLELHFRLWGSVGEGFAEWLFERSSPDPSLPAGGRRLCPCDAYLVAAVHEWLTPPPRPLGAWWDLGRIARCLMPAEVQEVIHASRRWGLQLPVVLAAEVSTALWNQAACQRIARCLSEDLRLAERWVAAWARSRHLIRCSLWPIQAARLFSGRPSRQGFKTVWRRLWAHPGLVERSTPEEWWWIRRRFSFQILRRRSFGG